MAPNYRNERFHDSLPDDQRNRARRDRDRILYSSAFQRLAGITQVVSPAEQRICHNRLTHSLKVGQVARRLSEFLIENNSDHAVASAGGIDPDVVEAASLAHDLGHPPFGHTAEIALQECMKAKAPRSETFEGNAQSFRVVTKLAVRSEDFVGLDLTRATLNALLKYPWRWDQNERPRKWGAYKEEEREFKWARKSLHPEARKFKTVEAEIMDTADDISYAVHDLEDFYRAGLVPLDRFVSSGVDAPRLTDEGEEFAASVFERCGADLPGTKHALRRTFAKLIAHSPVVEPYRGLGEQRAALRAFTSFLISQYIQSATLHPKANVGQRLRLPRGYRQEIFMLQQLTWYYVILNPALSAQQHGQRRLIKSLFEFFYNAACSGQGSFLPPRGRAIMQLLTPESLKGPTKARSCARIAADIISGMTEYEAQSVAHKILGISPGSAFDPFVQ